MEGWLTLLVLAVVIAGSGFVQSSIGFGYAIFSLAILPLVLDVRLANIVVSLSVLLPLASAVWIYRRGLDWRVLVWCLAGAALGLPVGLFVFTVFDVDWLVRSTGLVILLLAIDGLRGAHEDSPESPSRLWSMAAGAASGLLAGSVGIGGPPVAAYAARQDWSAVRFKAFLISFSLMLALLKAIGLAATGWIDRTVLCYSIAVVPFGLVGSYLGAIVSRNIDGGRIRRLAMFLLLLPSIGMIVRGRPDREKPAPASVAARASSGEPQSGRRRARRSVPSASAQLSTTSD